MGTRTVRLDEETEARLAEIRRETGLTISDVLTHGIRAAHNELVRESKSPWEIYRALDLGSGGHVDQPAAPRAVALKEAIRRTHRR